MFWVVPLWVILVYEQSLLMTQDPLDVTQHIKIENWHPAVECCLALFVQNERGNCFELSIERS